MDDTILSNINETVKPHDKLFILGDFTLGKLEHVLRYRDRIQCKYVSLVHGNHDRLTPQQYQDVGFYYLGNLVDLKIRGQKVTLCHYAMLRWFKSGQGAWHLFGHSHGTLPDDPAALRFDVGTDCHAFRPISWPEVSARMSARAALRIDDRTKPVPCSEPQALLTQE